MRKPLMLHVHNNNVLAQSLTSQPGCFRQVHSRRVTRKWFQAGAEGGLPLAMLRRRCGAALGRRCPLAALAALAKEFESGTAPRGATLLIYRSGNYEKEFAPMRVPSASACCRSAATMAVSAARTVGSVADENMPS